MYAVFESGGFQFNAQEGTLVKIPYLKANAGDMVTLDKVLFVKIGDDAHIGGPYLAGAKIEAEIVGDGLGEKVMTYKYKKRTKYRRTRGHRQKYSEIRIKKIVPPEH